MAKRHLELGRRSDGFLCPICAITYKKPKPCRLCDGPTQEIFSTARMDGPVIDQQVFRE